MARTYKDRHDTPHTRPERRHDAGHMGRVLRFSMGRYNRANLRHDVEASSRWFTAADRAARIVGRLTDLD